MSWTCSSVSAASLGLAQVVDGDVCAVLAKRTAIAWPMPEVPARDEDVLALEPSHALRRGRVGDESGMGSSLLVSCVRPSRRPRGQSVSRGTGCVTVPIRLQIGRQLAHHSAWPPPLGRPPRSGAILMAFTVFDGFSLASPHPASSAVERGVRKTGRSTRFHSPSAGAQEPAPAANRPGLRHIAFTVDDVRGVVDRVREAGWTRSGRSSTTRMFTSSATSADQKA